MTEFVDSFGIYDLIQGIDGTLSQISLRRRWNGTSVGNALFCQAGVGPRGGVCLVLPNGASLCKTFSHQSKYVVGLNISMGSPTGIGGNPLLLLCNNGLILCTLKVNLDGTIVVYGNNTSTTVLLTVSNPLVKNTFAYLELSSTISGTTNMHIDVQVWINGVSQGTGGADIGRNANTLTSGTATFNQLFLAGPTASNGQAYVADFYLNNGSGVTNTSNFGPVQIDAYPLPNGDDASFKNWIPLGGAGTHFSEINENPMDGDASYVLSSTAGAVDSYAWQDIVAFAGTVKSVQLTYCARTNAEGNRTFQGNIGAGGTEQQTNVYGLSSDYMYFHQSFDTDPATGLAWTTTGFNAKEFGLKLVS